MIPPLPEIPQLHHSASEKNPASAAARSMAPILKASTAHATRDFIGQCLGRTLGLSVFVGLAHASVHPIAFPLIAGGIGALAAGTQAYLIGEGQIGTTTIAQKAAVGLCTVTAALAGASIAGVGTIQAVSAVAVGAVATTTAALLGLYLCTQPEQEQALDFGKAVAFTMGTAASLCTVAVLIPAWSVRESTLASRSIGVLFEATLIELCKSSFEQIGPSVDRKALNFKGRLVTSMTGMLPYVVATVIFNSFVNSAMNPIRDSHEFLDLWPPLIVGALANAVRGATNAAVAWKSHADDKLVSNADTAILRASGAPSLPDPQKVIQKTAVRFFLSTCRNAVYFYLREKGLRVLPASCIAQSCYAVFAQNRDLIVDLMQGEGWHDEPTLSVRVPPPRQDTATAEEIAVSDSEV